MITKLKNHYNKLSKKEQEKFRKKSQIAGIALILFLIFAVVVYAGMPGLEELENPKTNLASIVYDIHGEKIGEFFIEKRQEIDIDVVPQALIDALIATEDRKFYDHWGVDVDRIIKAIVKTVFLAKPQGASTITQQLSKNLYGLKSSDENFIETGLRKIREWISSVQIERNYTKKEILEMYLNVSYFGRSAYGVQSAAETYFSKKVSELDVAECALLVAMLKSPEFYNPYSDSERRRKLTLERRNLVLQNMVEMEFLSEADRIKYREFKLPEKPRDIRRATLSTVAPYFLEYVRQQMTDIVKKHDVDLYRDGLKIYTTLDLGLQKIANKSVANQHQLIQKAIDYNWSWDGKEKIRQTAYDRAIKDTDAYRDAETEAQKDSIYNAKMKDKKFLARADSLLKIVETGFVVLDYRTGYVKAMVGGWDPLQGRGLNHTTQIKRQPGSSFKPLLYSVAIDNGLFPSFPISNEKFSRGGWSPNNADGKSGGMVTLRKALAYSMNIPAARLMIFPKPGKPYVSPYQVVDLAKRLGIKSQLDPNPSIALGTSEVSPLELCSAIGSIAYEGKHADPISILKVTDRNGLVLEQFQPKVVQAMDKTTAKIVSNMLEDVVEYGTASHVKSYYGGRAGGKTGTTQQSSDVWFVGYTQDLVAAVWVGFDDRRLKLPFTFGFGSTGALPIWGTFMAEAYANPAKYNIGYGSFGGLPEDVEHRDFCVESISRGEIRLAGPRCYNIVSDIIKKGKSIPVCDINHELEENDKEIDDNTGVSGW
ncbi:MAG: PBP1A family penicillin-binding protein [Ignavibacteriaceae bacterium]|nr:PBP1A family penicillin-binding protein [Ignavibacteriaceae bacterium]